ncbi:hypothetical protein [Marinobacter halophilus]|uniref:Uracil-DNA glycosylase-like domain-containing protein n=1 Tax=Marinobacter halophilus TaxID=1323740 RepID=A0A2T1KER2_9GAMM|nr:hypothetical protein [Marinobacter halophilus]PSF08616.1 hypothetical protein C7H08_08030 [Marinobacter halophilus]GGC62124.1 hypothetical protein GCM10011362_08310 [Marinobacter halophilus]
MNYYTEAFDNQLDSIELYQRYPLLKPFVGSAYGSSGPKVLLIAESHYLPSESSVHRDARRWYTGREGDLTPVEQRWMRTRRILNKPLRGWTAKGHAIYRNIESALLKAGLPANDSVFRQVAFMNAFQRPAITGASIKETNQDVEVAVDTINHVIEALKPDHIIFVSTKAKRAVGKRLNQSFVGVHHPACAWWNRKQNGVCSKERFISHMSKYWNATGAT